MPPLTIGKLAKEADVSVETVRYYERRGLIARPHERSGAYRVYPPDAVTRIRGIKRAQSLGFTLEEIKELLGLQIDKKARCQDVLEQAERKISEIDGKLRTLRAVKRELEKLASACHAELPVYECPIMHALSGSDEKKKPVA
ncbi:MAG: MerR family transcriptional regulator [bacterium]|nr:MerR family transcriptional regulator [bacterium]